VNDGVDPEITCPTNKVADTDPDVCTASVALDATATDNCTTEPTITYWIDGTEITSPYVFEVGTTTVMAKAEDDSGNEDTCGFDVTVNDGVDPEITCPEDKTVGTEAGACSASVVLDATATDNCTGEPTIRYWIDGVEITSPYDFSVGTTTVMAKAKDESGNESEPCYFDVTVNDGVDPEITCPTDKTVGTEAGVCTASVVLDATATDNCTGEPTITYWIDDTEITSPHVFEVGTTTVMAKAEDDSGNEDTCAFGVTVNDAEAPEITYCPSIKRPNDKGVCEAEVAFAVAAEDNCSVVVTYAIESTPGSGVFDDPIESPHVFPVGTTTVQATATDPGTQTDVCTFDVMVHDTEEPVIENCPEDITQPADPGEKGAVVWWKPPSVWDNCDGALVPTGDHKPGEFFPLGTTTVTYTVQDAAGNPAEPCVFTVTVVSDSTPVVINVELAGTVASPVTRCFTFELSKCDPPSTMTFEVELELVDSMASVEFAVPLDTYDCITARDRLHTLRRTIAPLPFNGAEHRYEADFTGEKALLSGDLNGDCWIDILDFGIYHSAYTTNYGTGDTTCETLPPHADLNGDGFVGTADFTFIQAHFLRGCDPDCCGRPGSPRGDDGPIAEISVKELKKRGLGRLAAADVNGDGWLNVEDMAAFMDGAPIDNDDLQESKMIGSR
ncbi:MAG: HYR domain-containing protein, partial [Phycisphaerae bacterium]|nr:HYR domain-containing protein [Phycisphaerae bacterium]